jgi:hypothetical protein
MVIKWISKLVILLVFRFYISTASLNSTTNYANISSQIVLTCGESLKSKIRLLLYFDISNSIVNQTISVPVGIDDYCHDDKRIIDYNTSNHQYLCRFYNLDEVICDYLQYKIYEVMYTIHRNGGIRTTRYHIAYKACHESSSYLYHS